MTVRRYTLARPARTWLELLGTLGMFGLGLWMFARGIREKAPGPFEYLFWTVWFGGLLWIAFRTLTAAREIVVREGDEIEFRSAVERQRVHAREIRAVRVKHGRGLSIVVRHAAGTIHLAGVMNDFHELVGDLKRANPGVYLDGC